MHRRTNLPSYTDSGHIDLICFSHLRWAFVYQRPQHLMSRFAKQRRVFFVEEPVFDSPEPKIEVAECPRTGVLVVVPRLPVDLSTVQVNETLRSLLLTMLRDHSIAQYIAWFYTPMALSFASELRPSVTVYDCMDELSLFKGASSAILEHETRLFERADLVFTGGLSLFEAKCERHKHIFPFPSSVDVQHFSRARTIREVPADQGNIPHPRIGYAGVIDERIDACLLADIALMRPDWQIVMIGPVVKISKESLPVAPNIHYLGMKPYSDLPAYFSGWEAAMLPFAQNEATRFISPTKTPEYLAAGLPVISTPIRDVIRPYGEIGLARIAASAQEFVEAMDEVLTYGMSLKWRERADGFLSTLSWDITWTGMNQLLLSALKEHQSDGLPATAPPPNSTAIAMERLDV